MIERHVVHSIINYIPTKDDPQRATGRSTGLALKYIAEAYNNIGQPVKIVDHHLSQNANKNLMALVRDMISALGLSGWTFDWVNVQLTYGANHRNVDFPFTIRGMTPDHRKIELRSTSMHDAIQVVNTINLVSIKIDYEPKE